VLKKQGMKEMKKKKKEEKKYIESIWNCCVQKTTGRKETRL
jgi:hypothetical protein